MKFHRLSFSVKSAQRVEDECNFEDAQKVSKVPQPPPGAQFVFTNGALYWTQNLTRPKQPNVYANPGVPAIECPG